MNKHDELRKVVSRYDMIGFLTYNSDAITTAICLTQIHTIDDRIFNILSYIASKFIWVDNGESLDVILKFLKPRVSEYYTLEFILLNTFRCYNRDAVNCYLVINKYYDTSTMNIYAEIYEAKGILHHITERYPIKSVIYKYLFFKGYMPDPHDF